MSNFQYNALDADGRQSKGIIEADSARSARAQLRDLGLYATELSQHSEQDQGGANSKQRLSETSLALLTRQWSTLLASGLTMEEALTGMRSQAENEAQKRILSGVRSEILAGFSLPSALDKFPLAFPPIYRASIQTGDKSGELVEVMSQLADYLERRSSLRNKTLQTLLYPAIVAVVATLVVIGLMTYVVPQVVNVFTQSHQSLPLLTRIVIGISNFLRSYGWLLILVLVGAGVVAQQMLKNRSARRFFHQWLLGLPLIGKHLRTSDSARFASTLSILSRSGVPLLSALEAGQKVIYLVPIQDAVERSIERVREGSSLARALGAEKQFPPLLIHMIANGESTGRLGIMLERAALLQQAELENRTAAITALLEPMLLLVMGGIVMLIVIAVMQPIIEINTLLK